MDGVPKHHFYLRGRTFYDKGPFSVARPSAFGTIRQHLAAILTPSPKISSGSTMTSPTVIPIRKPMRLCVAAWKGPMRGSVHRAVVGSRIHYLLWAGEPAAPGERRRDGQFADSPLEGTGFEPSVPRREIAAETGVLWTLLVLGLSPVTSRSTVRAWLVSSIAARSRTSAMRMSSAAPRLLSGSRTPRRRGNRGQPGAGVRSHDPPPRCGRHSIVHLGRHASR